MADRSGGRALRRVERRTEADERGATAIIAAALLVAVIGMGAYVIDIGAIFEERRDLQNGADAAALAVAMDCVVDGICSAAGAQPEAEAIASANSNDGQATVNETDIDFDLSNREVTVTVHTETSAGAGEIDLVLAPVLGEDSQAVDATATARWDAPAGATTIPLTISSCEWAEATSDGTVYGVYRIIHLHADGDSSMCDFGPGQDIDGDGDRNEGGFGYLDSSDCTTESLLGDFFQGQTGAGNPGSLGCAVSDLKDKTLLIPIFDDIPSDGSLCSAPPGQPCYHVYGFAAFHLEDLDLVGTSGPGGWRNNGNICGGADRCIGGKFVEFVSLEEAPDWSGDPPPDLGLSNVSLSG